MEKKPLIFLFAIALVLGMAHSAASVQTYCPINPTPSHLDYMVDPANAEVDVLVYNLTSDYDKIGIDRGLVYAIDMSDTENPNLWTACYEVTGDGTAGTTSGHAKFSYNPKATGCKDYRFIFCPQGNRTTLSGDVDLDGIDDGVLARQLCLNSTALPKGIITSPISRCIPERNTLAPKAQLGYLPSHNELYFCNQAPKDFAPLCWPLMLILGLLIGASFALGRNPFGSFDLSSPRMNRGRQYTPKTQQKSFDMMGYMFAMKSAADTAGKIGGAISGTKEVKNADGAVIGTADKNGIVKNGKGDVIGKLDGKGNLLQIKTDKNGKPVLDGKGNMEATNVKLVTGSDGKVLGKMSADGTKVMSLADDKKTVAKFEKGKIVDMRKGTTGNVVGRAGTVDASFKDVLEWGNYTPMAIATTWIGKAVAGIAKKGEDAPLGEMDKNRLVKQLNDELKDRNAAVFEVKSNKIVDGNGVQVGTMKADGTAVIQGEKNGRSVLIGNCTLEDGMLFDGNGKRLMTASVADGNKGRVGIIGQGAVLDMNGKEIRGMRQLTANEASKLLASAAPSELGESATGYLNSRVAQVVVGAYKSEGGVQEKARDTPFGDVKQRNLISSANFAVFSSPNVLQVANAGDASKTLSAKDDEEIRSIGMRPLREEEIHSVYGLSKDKKSLIDEKGTRIGKVEIVAVGKTPKRVVKDGDGKIIGGLVAVKGEGFILVKTDGMGNAVKDDGNFIQLATGDDGKVLGILAGKKVVDDEGREVKVTAWNPLNNLASTFSFVLSKMWDNAKDSFKMDLSLGSAQALIASIVQNMLRYYSLVTGASSYLRGLGRFTGSADLSGGITFVENFNNTNTVFSYSKNNIVSYGTFASYFDPSFIGGAGLPMGASALSPLFEGIGGGASIAMAKTINDGDYRLAASDGTTSFILNRNGSTAPIDANTGENLSREEAENRLQQIMADNSAGEDRKKVAGALIGALRSGGQVQGEFGKGKATDTRGIFELGGFKESYVRFDEHGKYSQVNDKRNFNLGLSRQQDYKEAQVKMLQLLTIYMGKNYLNSKSAISDKEKERTMKLEEYENEKKREMADDNIHKTGSLVLRLNGMLKEYEHILDSEKEYLETNLAGLAKMGVIGAPVEIETAEGRKKMMGEMKGLQSIAESNKTETMLNSLNLMLQNASRQIESLRYMKEGKADLWAEFGKYQTYVDAESSATLAFQLAAESKENGPIGRFMKYLEMDGKSQKAFMKSMERRADELEAGTQQMEKNSIEYASATDELGIIRRTQAVIENFPIPDTPDVAAFLESNILPIMEETSNGIVNQVYRRAALLNSGSEFVYNSSRIEMSTQLTVENLRNFDAQLRSNRLGVAQDIADRVFAPMNSIMIDEMLNLKQRGEMPSEKIKRKIEGMMDAGSRYGDKIGTNTPEEINAGIEFQAAWGNALLAIMEKRDWDSAAFAAGEAAQLTLNLKNSMENLAKALQEAGNETKDLERKQTLLESFSNYMRDFGAREQLMYRTTEEYITSQIRQNLEAVRLSSYYLSDPEQNFLENLDVYNKKGRLVGRMPWQSNSDYLYDPSMKAPDAWDLKWERRQDATPPPITPPAADAPKIDRGAIEHYARFKTEGTETSTFVYVPGLTGSMLSQSKQEKWAYSGQRDLNEEKQSKLTAVTNNFMEKNGFATPEQLDVFSKQLVWNDKTNAYEITRGVEGGLDDAQIALWVLHNDTLTVRGKKFADAEFEPVIEHLEGVTGDKAEEAMKYVVENPEKLVKAQDVKYAYKHKDGTKGTTSMDETDYEIVGRRVDRVKRLYESWQQEERKDK